MKTFSLGVLFVMSLTSLSFAGESGKNAGACANEDHYPLIKKDELSKIADQADSKDVLIVDVNSKESFDKAHVPNAIHFKSHEKDFVKELPKNKQALIVAYCGGPACTAWKKAAEIACEHGYTNVKHFKEGIKGWTSNGS